MKNDKKQVEITLTRHNAALVALIAKLKGTTEEELVSFCLKGSTNPTR